MGSAFSATTGHPRISPSVRPSVRWSPQSSFCLSSSSLARYSSRVICLPPFWLCRSVLPAARLLLGLFSQHLCGLYNMKEDRARWVGRMELRSTYVRSLQARHQDGNETERQSNDALNDAGAAVDYTFVVDFLPPPMYVMIMSVQTMPSNISTAQPSTFSTQAPRS